jgi:hypothetical protein
MVVAPVQPDAGTLPLQAAARTRGRSVPPAPWILARDSCDGLPRIRGEEAGADCPHRCPPDRRGP